MDYSSFHAIAEATTSLNTTYLVVGGIFAWAFVAWAVFRIRMRPVIRGLQAALKTVRASDGESSFAEHFESIRESLQSNKIVAHPWKEFEEVLLPDPSAQPPTVRNAQSPNDYFYRGSILGGRVNLRFYNSLPNLFTGLGILGTFVGLVAGIYLAGHGLGSDDPEQVQTALKQLLSGASLAFLTSIAGLISSILFNVAEKRRLHALDRLIGQWVAALDARLARITIESLASDQLAQSRQQTLALQQFSSELAWQIADEVGKKFSSDLGPTLEKLVTAVEGMRAQRNDDIGEMLERMTTDFQQSLSGAAGKELETLGTTLAAISDKLSTQIDSINETIQSASEVAEQHRQIAQDNRETIATLNEAGDRFGQLVEPIAQSAGNIRESADALQATGTEMRGAQEQVQQSVQQIATLHERLSETWDGYEKRFGDVDDSLANVFKELESGLSQYVSTVNEFIGGLDTHTSTITQNLAGAAQEINETLEEMQDSLSDQRRRTA